MRWRKLWQAEWAAPLIALIALSTAFSLYDPNFRKLENLSNIGFQTAVIVTLAAGQTLVIIAGGIDLSVGSVLALVGVVTALLLAAERPIALAVAAGLIVGVGCGFVNGFLVTKGANSSLHCDFGHDGHRSRARPRFEQSPKCFHPAGTQI